MEDQSTKVVICVDNELHEEIHPFGEEELELYKKVWTAEYYRQQDAINAAKVLMELEAKRLAKLRK